MRGTFPDRFPDFGSGKIPEMENTGLIERLKLATEASGISASAASDRAGLGRDYIRDLLRGKKKGASADALAKLAVVYSCDFMWLATGEGEAPKVHTYGGQEEPSTIFEHGRTKGEPPKIIAYGGPPLEQNAPKIPVFAAAQGGQGHLLITFDPIEHISAPPELASVRGAYGILVTGESMVPAFRPGDIAWVHPHRPPERDSDVVLYHVPPHTEAEAIIKTMVSWTPDKWKLRQYQPAKDFSESRADWPVCHRIVGKKSIR